MDNIARYNKGVNFLMVCIDTLSSYLWIEPVKRKTGALVADAFRRILARAEPRRPKQIFADRGLEFYNRTFMGLLERENILIYSTNTVGIKAAQAERAIRTLKNKLYKFLASQKSWKYLDHLSDIEYALNHSVNRTIGMSPSQVSKDNADAVFEKRYGDKMKTKQRPASFKTGDIVRTKEMRNVFKKEFFPRFSKSVYAVSDVIPSNPKMYKVDMIDSVGSRLGTLNRVYYSPELSMTKLPGTSFQDPPVSNKYRSIS